MYVNFQQLTRRIEECLAQKQRIIVAIDGNCTAGKTTLSDMLAQVFPCNVIRVDDFFLRPEQRTPDRFAQIGGNVDYERFLEEVLIPLQSGQSFAYRPFDCSTFTLAQPVEVQPKALTIIEGTYSHHPYFQDPYDLKIFLTVTAEVQKQRILQRPAFLHQRFFNEWIPMEQQYFTGFQIREQADIVTDSNSL